MPPYAPLQSRGSSQTVSSRLLATVLGHFGLVLHRPAPEHPLPGSPERCVSRTVVVASPGTLHAQGSAPRPLQPSLWMVERLAPSQAERRATTGRLLAALSAEGLAWVPAPLPCITQYAARTAVEVSPHVQIQAEETGSRAFGARPLAKHHASVNLAPRHEDPTPGPTGRTRPHATICGESGLHHMETNPASASRSLPAFVLQHEGSPWQVSPFVQGRRLPRPSYLDEAWRGEAVACCILGLMTAGGRMADIPDAPGDIPADGRDGTVAYVENMAEVIAPRHPAVFRRLTPVLGHLSGLTDIVGEQPVVLAHGDLHPLNIIWGDGPHSAPPSTGYDGAHACPLPVRGIHGVIDWEFAGARPLLYDAANCIGCAGFEHPSALAGPFVHALVKTLHAHAVPAAMIRLLPDMIMASRFGWISEWLRKRDVEMLEMELDYLDILLAERKRLRTLWGGA